MTHASAARANLPCWAVERYQGQSPYLHLYSLYEMPTGSVTSPLIKRTGLCPGIVLERDCSREYEQRSVGVGTCGHFDVSRLNQHVVILKGLMILPARVGDPGEAATGSSKLGYRCSRGSLLEIRRVSLPRDRNGSS